MTLLLLAVLLPLVGGAVLPLFRFQQERPRSLYVEAVVLVTSALTWWAICLSPEGELPLLRMTDTLTLTLHLDGMSKVFAGLVSFLWPLASLYGFEYMRHENRPNAFFAYYTMSYGVTLAVALAGNLFSLYVFYECLTMVTLPLVTHKKDAQSIRAGRKYLIFSISGAALAFIALIFIMHYGVSTDFVLGGVLDMSKVAGHEVVLRLVFLLAFIGFGTKAAVFPMYAWLPAASVAPTPVTALLHAVAVVNAGAYAVIRVIYYSFGASFLYGSVAQIIAVCLACFTILFGSTMAVREQHFKRRLAYSTVSNLHGLMKIGLFYCAGAVLVQTGKEYVQDLRGMGRVMPFTFTCFTIGSIAMVGIPPLCGFVSKWNLLTAAADTGSWWGIVAIATLIISAILTAVYLFTVVSVAWFRPLDASDAALAGKNTDPGWQMKLPLALLCVMVVLCGVFSTPLVQWLRSVAAGLVL